MTVEIRTPQGVFRPSDDSGVLITVTQPSDPAYALLTDGHTTTPTVYKRGCYICEDPEFAQMGLPLCKPCLLCGGHVAADDCECDDCGADQYGLWIDKQWERVLAQPQSICRGDGEKHAGLRS